MLKNFLFSKKLQATFYLLILPVTTCVQSLERLTKSLLPDLNTKNMKMPE